MFCFVLGWERRSLELWTHFLLPWGSTARGYKKKSYFGYSALFIELFLVGFFVFIWWSFIHINYDHKLYKQRYAWYLKTSQPFGKQNIRFLYILITENVWTMNIWNGFYHYICSVNLTLKRANSSKTNQGKVFRRF